MEEKVLDCKLTIKHSRLLEILLKYKVRKVSPSLDDAIPRLELWVKDFTGPSAVILITEVGAHLIAENFVDPDNSKWQRICKDYGIE